MPLVEEHLRKYFVVGLDCGLVQLVTVFFERLSLVDPSPSLFLLLVLQ